MRLVVLLALCGACRFGFDANALGFTDAGDGDSGSLDGDAGDTFMLPAIVTPPAACADGMQNGAETGVDCGGLCAPCDRCATNTIAGSSCFCNVEWMSGGPSPVAFSAAYAASPSAAVIAGQGGHIQWWDGTRFSTGYVGNGTIEAAAGTSPDDIWLAGTEVWHWNGVAWTKQNVPGTVTVRAMHARAPNDVWGVGSSGRIYHYDGANWTLSTPFTGTPSLTGVYALGQNDVLIVALDGTVNRWNGTTLTPVTSPAFTQVRELVGVSATEAYVIAPTTTNSSGSVYRWNGVTFTDITAPFSAMEALAVDGANLWVLGSNEVARYNGSGWDRFAMPAGYVNATAISTAARTELAVSGGRVFVADDGKRMTFDGTTWTTVGLTAEDVNGVWGDGADFHAMTGSSWLYPAGGQLVRVPAPTTSATLWGTAADDVWAVGTTAAHHYDGSTWTNRGAASGMVAGSSTTDVWAVPGLTTAPTARHWTGSMFENTTMPNDFQVEDIWAIGPTDAWAAGRRTSTAAPALAKWNGSMWSLVTAPPSATYLTSVWASAATDVWVVSISSATANIWRYDGGSWSDVSGGSGTAFASKIRGGGAGVFVGAQGRVAKWNGSGWASVTSGGGSCPSTPSVRLWVTATDVWVGGQYGMVGRATP